ncbi:MAG: L-threonylcarbamoyladenylate synthase, partial [Verrucomicrobiota bacterium]
MSCRIIQIDPHAIEPDGLKEPAGLLRDGGVVVFPTETVYGLGANALDQQAVQRIFEIKRRPASDPLIVHIPDTRRLEAIAREIPPIAFELAAAFWPGPLTMVLKKNADIPADVTAG